jgi:hypothetical protein
MMNFAMKQFQQEQSQKRVKLLPTRQELAAFLQSKNISPTKLNRMSAWEQVQLTREYQSSLEVGS